MSVALPKIILHSDQSFQLTSQTDTKLLVSLTGKRTPRIGYLPSTPDPRRTYFKEKVRYYEQIGFSDVIYFDPEESTTPEAQREFFSRDVIHLSGGRVGVFRDRLYHTGCDKRIVDFVARGGVLLGVSAGAMVLGKTFASASLFGEKGPFAGLGFFDFEIVPHVSEMFPRLELLQRFAQRQKTTVYALNDGDVIIIHGKKIRTYGAAIKMNAI